MALTYSKMLPLGTELPKFELLNVLTDKDYSTDNLISEKNTVVMIICNHCPYVIHYHDELKKLIMDYDDKLRFIAISSNDVENYPQDSPEKMKKLFRDLNTLEDQPLLFPFLSQNGVEVSEHYRNFQNRK